MAETMIFEQRLYDALCDVMKSDDTFLKGFVSAVDMVFQGHKLTMWVSVLHTTAFTKLDLWAARSFSAVVEHMAHDEEVMGLNPSKLQGHFLLHSSPFLHQ